MKGQEKASLELDTFFLNELKGFGIPELKTYGRIKHNTFYAIVMEYLGPSLDVLFKKQKRKFSLKTTCMLGIQMIDRIEFLHSKKYIHRDIKPSNFLMGRGEKSHVLYLCDFGISKKYWTNDGHVDEKYLGKFAGTEKYASVNSIKGNQQSRKDDLISIAYVLINFLNGSLPWDVGKDDEQKLSIKISTKIQDLCKGLPKEIYEFLWCIDTLKFNEVPKYKKLKNFLRDAVINSKEKIDYKYDWFTKIPNINDEDDILKDHYNIDYNSNDWLNY